ncbi:hypothetical protein HNR46_001574 [Haloferula luteola]|uniref:Uncharacterized protein n=1 Tax=Haloferula luteola TaxID=595692 RepID=A0A840V9G4_9BACT|nr:hypothetical protein [Haloferula luteola]MBB5351338.1 hypothetical protein [Haloferula luteola]
MLPVWNPLWTHLPPPANFQRILESKGDKAWLRVITAMFKDDAQLFKQFQDNESFRKWLTDTMFDLTKEKR